MHDSADVELGKMYRELSPPPPRSVHRADGTIAESPYLHPEGTPGYDENQVDGLFGASASYVKIKKESPTHRLILWMRMQGHKPKEIAAALRITPQTVYNVQGQPWFQEAFVRLSTEQGKDAVTTFLEGEVLPAMERTAALARSADSDAVKLAANREILDRFLGKSTVKIESKNSGTIDHIVHNADALQKEYAENQKKLAARGLGINVNGIN